jgi:short-subunit dehydrogenase
MNIVLTGASKGIGYQTALILSRDQHNEVFAIARNKLDLENLRSPWYNDDVYENIHIIPFDIVNGNYKEELLPAILGRVSQIDVLINNAGFLINKPFENMADEEFDDIFSTNVKGVYQMIRSLLPFMAEHSHIVNIGSMGGIQGSIKFPGLSLYSASKGAVAILTECLAEEFKGKKISVNCLALGSAQTEMLEAAFPGYKSPLTAGEMAEFIAYFALNGHRWFNGKVLPVALNTP